MLATYWAILGLLLICLEIFSGTFFLLFLGIGALLTAFAKWLNVVDSLAIETALFAFLSLLNIALFRKKIKVSMTTNPTFAKEQSIRLEEDLAPQEKKSISYQGSLWQALNTTSETMPKGAEVLIEKIEGVTLHLRSKGEK